MLANYFLISIFDTQLIQNLFMKKLFKVALFVLAMMAFTAYESMAQTVYVTDKGKKYHAKNCDLVKTGKKGMELAEATKAGYGPCGHCKVDAADTKKAAPAKKKK